MYHRQACSEEDGSSLCLGPLSAGWAAVSGEAGSWGGLTLSQSYTLFLWQACGRAGVRFQAAVRVQPGALYSLLMAVT